MISIELTMTEFFVKRIGTDMKLLNWYDEVIKAKFNKNSLFSAKNKGRR